MSPHPPPTRHAVSAIGAPVNALLLELPLPGIVCKERIVKVGICHRLTETSLRVDAEATGIGDEVARGLGGGFVDVFDCGGGRWDGGGAVVEVHVGVRCGSRDG